jgi:hypothetical protein
VWYRIHELSSVFDCLTSLLNDATHSSELTHRSPVASYDGYHTITSQIFGAGQGECGLHRGRGENEDAEMEKGVCLFEHWVFPLQ